MGAFLGAFSKIQLDIAFKYQPVTVTVGIRPWHHENKGFAGFPRSLFHFSYITTANRLFLLKFLYLLLPLIDVIWQLQKC